MVMKQDNSSFLSSPKYFDCWGTRRNDLRPIAVEGRQAPSITYPSNHPEHQQGGPNLNKNSGLIDILDEVLNLIHSDNDYFMTNDTPEQELSTSNNKSSSSSSFSSSSDDDSSSSPRQY